MDYLIEIWSGPQIVQNLFRWFDVELNFERIRPEIIASYIDEKKEKEIK